MDRKAPGQKSRTVRRSRPRPHLVVSAGQGPGLLDDAEGHLSFLPEPCPVPPPTPSNSQTHVESDFQFCFYLSHTTVIS